MPLEQDKSNGFKLGLDAEINTGLYPEVFSRRIPMWETGNNIQFTEFGVEKVRGSQQAFDVGSGEPIRGLVQNVVGTDPYIYAGDLQKLYEYNVNSLALATRGTGYTLLEDSGGAVWDTGSSTWDTGLSIWDGASTFASSWSMVNYGAFILATNGVDAPQIQKGVGTNFINVLGMGTVTTAEIFIKRGPHVLAFNTNISDREFIWSDADNLDDWVASADNLAGQLEIRELKTAIKAAAPIGGRIAVYGEDQMFVVNYLGNDLVFGYQPAINGVGAVSKHAIVPVGRKNYGLSSQGFFVTDGSSFDYIDDPAMRHWFQNNINTTQSRKVVGWHDEEETQIRWYFPSTTTKISQAVSYNYVKNVWSFLSGDRSAGDERRVIGTPITGTETGLVRYESTGNNEDTTAISCFVRSKPMDLGDADRVKELDSIRIGFRGMGLQYRIGWSEAEDGPIYWLAATDMEQGFNFHNLRTSGRWLYLELLSDTLNAEWEVMSLEVIGRAEGTR